MLDFPPADWSGSYFPFKAHCWLAGRESFNPHTSPAPGPCYWVLWLNQVPQYYKEYNYVYTSNNHLRCNKSRQETIGNYHFLSFENYEYFPDIELVPKSFQTFDATNWFVLGSEN